MESLNKQINTEEESPNKEREFNSACKSKKWLHDAMPLSLIKVTKKANYNWRIIKKKELNFQKVSILQGQPLL